MAELDRIQDEGAGNASIYALRDQLEAARLEAITEAAAASGGATVSTEAASRIGHLHLALLAVRDEIEAHTPKLGAGSEQPLQ
jgi:hypothetical protein